LKCSAFVFGAQNNEPTDQIFRWWVSINSSL